MFNIFDLLKNSKDISGYMQSIKDKQADKSYTASTGSDYVTITLNGNFECLDLKINPKLLAENDLESLQNLIKLCYNEAHKKAKEQGSDELLSMASQIMSKLNPQS